MVFAPRWICAALLMWPLTAWTSTAWSQDSAALQDDPDAWPRRAAFLGERNADWRGDALTAPLIACSGTACRHFDPIELTPDEADELTGFFRDVTDSRGERTAIARAIGRFEDFVGFRNGTWADAPGNTHSDWDEPDQLDCVSEAVNTRTYLTRLAGAGLITHHHVVGLITRYTFFLQHVAVVLSDDDDRDEDGIGALYVVDSWVGANGEPPDIEPKDVWRSHWAV